MKDHLIFKLQKVVLSQDNNKIVLYLPFDMISRPDFLRCITNSNVELTICGSFNFVPVDCVGDLSADKPIG